MSVHLTHVGGRRTLAAGTLPKTSSGKLQRSLCRDRYLAAELIGV